MSYDIRLVDTVTLETLQLDAPHHMRGGTYQVGGCPEAALNVTYNYWPHYRRVMGEKGVRSIYGMTGAESVALLKSAISQLADDVDADYWKPTEGNAKRALCQLLALAQMRPDGVWRGLSMKREWKAGDRVTVWDFSECHGHTGTIDRTQVNGIIRVVLDEGGATWPVLAREIKPIEEWQ